MKDLLPKTLGGLLHVAAVLLLIRGFVELAGLWKPWNPYDVLARGVAWLGAGYVLWRWAGTSHMGRGDRRHRLDARIHTWLGWCLVVIATLLGLAYALNPWGIDGAQASEAERTALMSRLQLDSAGSPRYVRIWGRDPSDADLTLIAAHSARPVLPWSQHPNPTACRDAATARTAYYACDADGYPLWVGPARAPLWRIHEVNWRTGDCSGTVLLVRAFDRWRILKSWTDMCFTAVEPF